jgi:hypothetical protein
VGDTAAARDHAARALALARELFAPDSDELGDYYYFEGRAFDDDRASCATGLGAFRRGAAVSEQASGRARNILAVNLAGAAGCLRLLGRHQEAVATAHHASEVLDAIVARAEDRAEVDFQRAMAELAAARDSAGRDAARALLERTRASFVASHQPDRVAAIDAALAR